MCFFFFNLFADISSCSNVDWAICRFWPYLAGVPLLCPWLFISLSWCFSRPTPQCWWPYLWVTLLRHRAIHWRRGEDRRGASRSASFITVLLSVLFIILWHSVSFRLSLEFWTLLSGLKIPTVLAFKVSQAHKCQIITSKVLGFFFHAVWSSFEKHYIHICTIPYLVDSWTLFHISSAVHLQWGQDNIEVRMRKAAVSSHSVCPLLFQLARLS